MENRKFKKSFITIISIVFMMCTVFTNVYADDNTSILKKEEYSKDFQEWLNLSDEEKQKVLMPNMYEDENVYTMKSALNPIYRANMLKASSQTKYSLKDVIPENLVIRDQKNTSLCWAIASLSSLETNLAMSDKKVNISPAKVYDFSERHLEYATSKTFLNNAINENGFNREVGSGGSYLIAQAYLTNGMGAIDESEMPFEDNESKIDISKIKNKKITSQVYDTVKFDNYNNLDDTKKKAEMDQIKEHIQNYGAVYAGIHMGTNARSEENNECFNEQTGAKYCKDNTHSLNHGVSIIGWDDDYDISNFVTKPSQKGAWIVRNSWGDKNQILYVSYEDYNIGRSLWGIEKSANTLDYDNLYQYDNYGASAEASVNNSDDGKFLLYQIFDKKNSATEFLKEISIDAPQEYKCKVYVNPNGTDVKSANLKQIKLKTGDTETIGKGYHTLEFAKSTEITGNKFAVLVEVEANTTKPKISVESKISNTTKIYDNVKVESGKCFVAPGNDIDSAKWSDIGSIAQADSTIKAFTTNVLDDGSLKNIEISTNPTKVNYIAGENFDATGMVLKATYNTKDSKTEILDNSKYQILNGTNLAEGQKSVTIKYEDETVDVPITVAENPNAINSKFSNLKATVSNLSVKSDDNKSSVKMTVEVTGITKNTKNDKLEYYYYLSNSNKEENITDWVKIDEEQKDNDKLNFTIDTSKMSNADELEGSTNPLYLYIREVATKGTNTSIYQSDPIELKLTDNTEEEVDGKKVDDTNNYKNNDENGNNISNYSQNANTTSRYGSITRLPNAGSKFTLIIVIIALSGICIFAYIKYRNLNKYIKK